MVDWYVSLSQHAEPLSCLDLHTKVFQITGRKPSIRWVQQFLEKNPSLVAKWAHPLDLKWAQQFTPENTYHYFDLLEEVISTYEIPVENIYNTDEKGVQLGGRQKASTTQQIFHKDDKNRYVLKEDSLLLVTIIETVSTHGVPCPLCIIMPPGETGDWISVEGLRR